MELKEQVIYINVETNIEKEKAKAKELVSLLERANELIQSLKSIDIKL